MINLPPAVQTVIATLQNKGYEGYVVGGSVRDLLMNRSTKGWDFTTSATPEQILALFPDSFYDNQFGTVGVKMPDDIFEITTYRSAKGYTDHRHPDKVMWGKTLEEDLSRRDFTINAIAYDGKTLVDPYGGQKDIDNKIIRAVGDPENALRKIASV